MLVQKKGGERGEVNLEFSVSAASFVGLLTSFESPFFVFGRGGTEKLKAQTDRDLR